MRQAIPLLFLIIFYASPSVADDTLAEYAQIVGLRLGDDCGTIQRQLGDTKYVSSYQGLQVISYSYLDHHMAVDVQCRDQRIIAISVQRIAAKSKLNNSTTAAMLKMNPEQLTELLGDAHATRTGTILRSAFYCMKDGVLVLDFDGQILRYLSLLTPDRLSPNKIDCPAILP